MPRNLAQIARQYADERDQALKERDQLLEGIREHREALPNVGWAQAAFDLYDLADSMEQGQTDTSRESDSLSVGDQSEQGGRDGE